jgi:hypothetical protein
MQREPRLRTHRPFRMMRKLDSRMEWRRSPMFLRQEQLRRRPNTTFRLQMAHGRSPWGISPLRCVFPRVPPCRFNRSISLPCLMNFPSVEEIIDRASRQRPDLMEVAGHFHVPRTADNVEIITPDYNVAPGDPQGVADAAATAYRRMLFLDEDRVGNMSGGHPSAVC